jgi:hypothetical protein
VFLGLSLEAAAQAAETLLKFGPGFDLSAVGKSDVQLALDGEALRLTTGHKADWPGVTLKAPKGRWDLAAFAHVALDVKNVGKGDVTVSCRVDNPGADGTKNCVTQHVSLKPGERQTLRVPLERSMSAALRSKLFAMRGYPGGAVDKGGIDPANVTQLLVFVNKPKADHTFTIGNLRADGAAPPAATVDPAKFFPMIDQYGQYMHKDWPGKVHSDAELAKNKAAEAADLKARPGPRDWNQYGGWQAGPKLAASGFFRVEKLEGKWWLVDPEGRLFWSHGNDCVHGRNAVTPITDREFYFAALPPKDSPFGRFYGTGNWAPHNYYEGRGQYATFDFTGANLLRKYGPEWKREYAELAHRRLRSWGMNTIANWSDADIYLLRKTPYTATVGRRGKPIQGSEGYWGKFDDVFDPVFAEGLRRAMAREKGRSAGDPWCLGYFVGNELSWGNETSLALATLRSPADQAAKKVFIDDLKKKYNKIERLNAAWGTQHASWDALLSSTTPPDAKKARDDLVAFYTHTAEEYFRVCREAVKEAAPQQLYLGCRFAWANDLAVRASAKYCDVVSFNRYNRSVADLKLPAGVDKPVVIGEFHFGALDRGMFHTGLVKTASQQERADAYRAYVRSALENPLIVGTHWFQFADQATTGRGDGENYQIGFLDVCDTPYGETIAASREIGAEMYWLRKGK